MAALAIDRSLVGIREATGHNDGQMIHEIQRYVGIGMHDPYCAATASWGIFHAAAKLGITPKLHKTGSSADFYRQGVHLGLVLEHPIPGCLALLKGGPNGFHHTATVVAVHLQGRHSFVSTIDGNWGNRIASTSHPVSICKFVGVA